MPRTLTLDELSVAIQIILPGLHGIHPSNYARVEAQLLDALDAVFGEPAEAEYGA
jgi:hemoglobin-like flavoprotein